MDFVWASPGGPTEAPPAAPAQLGLPEVQATVAVEPEIVGSAEAKEKVVSDQAPAAAAPAIVPADGRATEDGVAKSTPEQMVPVAPATEVAAEDTAAGASAASAGPGAPTTLRVTTMPPDVLVPGGIHREVCLSEDVEMNGKAVAGVIGKGGANIKEIEQHSGVKATIVEPQEGETVRCLRLEGTKVQIADAKGMLEQKIVQTIGAKAAEKMQKHIKHRLLERKRYEAGSEAAKEGVKGLSEFCNTWKIKALTARKLARMDAMLQRYLMRHFKPLKAKPDNALKTYMAGLQKHPQRWRLNALHEDGELDGEVCETVAVSEDGAIVGSQRNEADARECLRAGQQLIELEVNRSLGEPSRIYGDVQEQHCKLLRMSGDFYVWALETQIGTILDGQKYRQHDGPVPVRDGSVIGVGKYLLYCEVGTAEDLQERRKRMLEIQSSVVRGAPGALLEEAAPEAVPESAQGTVADVAPPSTPTADAPEAPAAVVVAGSSRKAEASEAAPPSKRRKQDDVASMVAEAQPQPHVIQAPPRVRSSAAAAVAAYEASLATGATEDECKDEADDEDEQEEAEEEDPMKAMMAELGMPTGFG